MDEALQVLDDGYEALSDQIAPTEPPLQLDVFAECFIAPELAHRLFCCTTTATRVQVTSLVPQPFGPPSNHTITHVSRQGLVVSFGNVVTTPAGRTIFAHNLFIPHSNVRSVWAAGTTAS